METAEAFTVEMNIHWLMETTPVFGREWYDDGDPEALRVLSHLLRGDGSIAIGALAAKPWSLDAARRALGDDLTLGFVTP